MVMAEDRDILAEQLEEKLKELNQGRPRILVVDDEPAILNMLERILSDEYDILLASSGTAGLELLKEHPEVEVIVSDQRMPFMSGTEFLNRSMDICPDCTRIILTGYVDAKDLVASINTGRVFQYITKPFEPDDLRMQIRRGVEYYRKNKELKIVNEEIQRAYHHLRQTQEELIRSEKMSLLGRLMATVAHEVRNPLNNINNSIRLFHMDWPPLKELLERVFNPPPEGYTADQLGEIREQAGLKSIIEDIDAAIRIIANSYEMAWEIIEDIRGFSRLDDARFVNTDINFQINRALKLIQPKFRHQVEFILELGDIPQIKGLPGPITQVFMNILNNAGQAVLPSGIVTVRSRRENNSVVVEIADNGHGIAPEHLNKIFEYGFTTKKENEGTGLGLAISYDIMQKHRGDIRVESQVGQGTTFRILFPLEE